MQNDLYNIALGCILENYVHFLNQNNAIGKIVYESRDEAQTAKAPDVLMYQNFACILANNKGIISIDQKELRNRIRTFDTISKKSASPGLELADFISFYLLKAIFIDDAQKATIMKEIEKKLYNGNYDVNEKNLKMYYGVRFFPFDVQLLEERKIEIARLKKALKKEKADNKKLQKKIEQIIDEKRRLKEQYDSILQK